MRELDSVFGGLSNRRQLLARCGGGAGMLGLATLLADELSRNLGWKVAAEATQRMNPGDAEVLQPTVGASGDYL